MRVEPSQFVEHRNKHRPREVSFGKRKAKDSNCKARAVGLPLLQEPRTAVRQLWRGMMKALFAALALVTLLASPTFAQTANSPTCGGYGWGPSSPCYGANP
jgi:hypothetical protein